MNILDKLAELSRERVKADQAVLPESELRNRAEALGKGNGFLFHEALKKPGISFICEIKKHPLPKG